MFSHYDRLVKALRHVVSESLEVKKSWQVSDSEREQWEEHTRRLLEHTYLRQEMHTRSRLDHEGAATAPGRMEESKRLSVEKLVALCNGDIRATKIVHVCDGCCTSREETIDAMVQALLENDILCGRNGLPAESRWGSVTETNANICLAVLFHNLFPRCWKVAFPTWESGSEGLDIPERPLEDDSMGLRHIRRPPCKKTKANPHSLR